MDDHRQTFIMDLTNSTTVSLTSSSNSTIVSQLLFGFLLARSVVSVAVIVLNLLTIISVLQFQRLRTTTNSVVISLAVADLLAGLLNPMLFGMQYISSMGAWRGICQGLESLDILATGGNIFSITFIAIDRYLHVVKYLSYQYIVTPKRLAIALSLMWCYVLTAAVVICFFGGEIYQQAQCAWTLFITRTVYYYVIIPHVAVLTIITVSLYCKISFFLHKQRRHMAQYKGKSPSSTWSNSRSNNTMATVVLVYLLTTIPAALVSAFVRAGVTSVPLIVTREGLIFLWCCQGWINPLIYAWRRPEFRSAYKRLLCISEKLSKSDTEVSSTKMTTTPAEQTKK